MEPEPDWGAVLAQLDAQFPRELKICMQAVRIAELEAAASNREAEEFDDATG